MNRTLKAREMRALTCSYGYLLRKLRRSIAHTDLRNYRILKGNCILALSLTLDDVEGWLAARIL